MFGRRRPDTTQQRSLAEGTVAPYALAPRYAAAPVPHVNGTTGWLPGYGTPSAHQQIGRFAGTLLTQTPAMLPGPQLHSGHEGNNPHWYYPASTPLPYGSITQTTTPSNIVGATRNGQQFSGPVGPLNARAMYAQVVLAQLRQSGQLARGWVAALTPGGGNN